MSFKFDPHQARAIPLLKRNTRAVLPWKPGWGKTAPTLEAAYDRSGADPVIWCTDEQLGAGHAVILGGCNYIHSHIIGFSPQVDQGGGECTGKWEDHDIVHSDTM